MVKVTVKENVMDKEGRVDTKLRVIEHKDGIYATVHNGVLTVFAEVPVGSLNGTEPIAGYEPSAWMSWVKE